MRAQATSTKLVKKDVPLKLEEGPMPLNTFNNKAPFKATVRSVERIVGPKATGETCHIIIETQVRSAQACIHVSLGPHNRHPTLLHHRLTAALSRAGQDPLLGGVSGRRQQGL